MLAREDTWLTLTGQSREHIRRPAPPGMTAEACVHFAREASYDAEVVPVVQCRCGSTSMWSRFWCRCPVEQWVLYRPRVVPAPVIHRD